MEEAAGGRRRNRGIEKEQMRIEGKWRRLWRGQWECERSAVTCDGVAVEKGCERVRGWKRRGVKGRGEGGAKLLPR